MFEYETRLQNIELGSYTLKIEALANLDQTIDQLFNYLKETGQEKDLDRLSPYFGMVWPSGQVMAQKVAALPEDAHTRSLRCLEIGCGLALPSLIARKKGMHILATDSHPHVPDFIEKNCKHNEIESLPYQNLHWLDSPEGSWPRYDLILGSDILYESYHAASVAKMLSLQLAPRGRAWITDPARPYLQDFVNEMTQAGFKHQFSIERIPLETPTAMGETKDIFFFEFWR